MFLINSILKWTYFKNEWSIFDIKKGTNDHHGTYESRCIGPSWPIQANNFQKGLVMNAYNCRGDPCNSNKVCIRYIFKKNYLLKLGNGILIPKLFWPTVRKKCLSNRKLLLKFEAEGREFAKFLRSLEQFIQTVKGQNNFY